MGASRSYPQVRDLVGVGQQRLPLAPLLFYPNLQTINNSSTFEVYIRNETITFLSKYVISKRPVTSSVTGEPKRGVISISE